MIRALLVLWMALIGADRLDLAGGSLPAVATPFLALTPVVLGALAWERWATAKPLQLGRATLCYLLLSALFLAAVGASALTSLDPDTTVARSVLLVIQLGGATAVALMVHDDPRAQRFLREGATLGVMLFVVMNALAVLAFLGVLPMTLQLGPASLRLDSYGYAGVIPRLSGTAIDPNQAGSVLLVYAFLAPRARWWALALLAFTLSRSAALGAVVLVIASAWQFGWAHRPAPVRRLLLAVAVVAAGLVLVARSPATVEDTARMIAPFSERFGVGEGGSSAQHSALIVRAAAEGSRSIPRALLGLGWGASYVVLQDFFPGNRYGNFHSLYGTVFAETGIFALVLVLAMLFLPLARATQWRPLVAAFIVFNFAYESNTAPAFWFLLALAWVAQSSLQSRQVTLASGRMEVFA
jgi:hypothetical protein